MTCGCVVLPVSKTIRHTIQKKRIGHKMCFNFCTTFVQNIFFCDKYSVKYARYTCRNACKSSCIKHSIIKQIMEPRKHLFPLTNSLTLWHKNLNVQNYIQSYHWRDSSVKFTFSLAITLRSILLFKRFPQKGLYPFLVSLNQAVPYVTLS